MAKDKLVTSGYCLILAANFLLYFAFYLILPVLPFYLTEVFHTGNAAVGVILSCYTIASLCIRPFSGYLLDTLARKPLYLVAYFIFITIFAGYMLAGVLSIFIMLRVVHGLAFGMVTVAGNTIVIDITPSSRRGEAVGYYGLMNNTAMSFGPMIGLSCMTSIPLKRFLPARSYRELSVLLPHASSRPHPNNQSNENLSHWTALCC